MSAPELHSSIIALVSLASGIASKHPDMGLCQLEKLRGMGIPDEQIATVIEIARHIRDEAAQKLDAAFDEKAGIALPEAQRITTEPTLPELQIETGNSCCSTTPSGQSCC
ncbi:MAG: hypothetical protein D6720_05540 [Gammaproteobacteria bacterium]|nr:MAG: hypothetical protein D6720_05540 [Gammaproteobacteria bacterium]